MKMLENIIKELVDNSVKACSDMYSGLRCFREVNAQGRCNGCEKKTPKDYTRELVKCHSLTGIPFLADREYVEWYESMRAIELREDNFIEVDGKLVDVGDFLNTEEEVKEKL